MKGNNQKGKFVVLEGLDGSGQSTQAALLKKFLIEKGYKVVLTKEPTMDSEAGKRIRRVLDKQETMPLDKLQELFVQDRAEHLAKLIEPSLEEGKIVISDRYFFSTLAYGAASGIELEWLIDLNRGFLLPDLTVILKVAPEVCMERIGKRGEPQTLFEQAERLRKVWDTYRIMPKRFENVHIIDGERPIEEVFEEIKKLAHSKLNI